MKKNTIIKKILPYLITAIIVVGSFFAITFGITNAGEKLTANGLKTTEDNLRRAAVTCYSIEGRYPESLEYLVDNYNVNIDTSKYYVYYTVFGSNIMPDITVAAK